MTREDAQAKARRLVAEGRVTIRRIGGDLIMAHVRGDQAEVYVVTWDPDGWSDSCPALGRCSHIRAVQLVTLTHDLEHEVVIGGDVLQALVQASRASSQVRGVFPIARE